MTIQSSPWPRRAAGACTAWRQAPSRSSAGAEDLPHDLPAVGWLRPATESLLRSAGVDLVPETELRSFGEAASRSAGVSF